MVRTWRFAAFLLLALLLCSQAFAASPPVYQSDLPYRGVNRYGATGDGTTDDTAALQRAITAATASGDTLYFRGGNTYRIATDLTFPANVTLRFGDGSSLKRDNSATVTLNGPIEAPACPILQNVTTGPGKYTFSASAWEGAVPEWFGAKGDGATDDSAAFAAFFAARPAGAAARLSGKTYDLNSTLNLNGFVNMAVLGRAGMSDLLNNGGTVLRFTGAVTNGVTLGSARGVQFHNVQLRYCSTSTTGSLVTGAHVGGGDTAHIEFIDCSFTYDAAFPGAKNSAAQLILLDASHDVGFVHCSFSGGTYHVRGKSVNAINCMVNCTSGYAIDVHFSRCDFHVASSGSILDPDQSWLFQNCTWEPLVSGAAGAVSFGAGFTASGLTFSGCWMGDDVAGTNGHWIDWSGGSAGLAITGSAIGVNPGTTAIAVTGNNALGMTVMGNTITGNHGGTGIDFGTTTGAADFVALGNSFAGLNTTIAGNIPAGSLYSNGGMTQVSRGSIDSPIVSPALAIGPVTPPNLLSTDSATIEGSVGNWQTYFNSAVSRSTDQALEGTHSLKMVASAGGTAMGAYLTGTLVPVSVGQHFAALASFRAAATSEPVSIELDGLDNNGSNPTILAFSGYSSSDTTSGWTQVTCQGVVKSGTSFVQVVLRVGNGSTSTVAINEAHYVDEISVTRDSSGIWAAPGQATAYFSVDQSSETSSVPVSGPSFTVSTGIFPNLLSEDNATIEGSIGTWAVNDNCTVAQSGAQHAQQTKSLSLTATGGVTSHMSAFIQASGAVPVTVGRTYYALASFRSAVTPQAVDLDIYGLDAGNTVIGETRSGFGTPDTTSGWTQISVPFTVPIGVTKAWIVARVGDASVGSTLTPGEVHYIDQMSISQNSDLVWRDPTVPSAFFTANNATITTSVPIVMSTSATPASAAAAGVTGQFAWDTNFVYVYTGTGWKRAALSAW